MLRVQYYIGNREPEEVFSSLYEGVSPDDVLAVTTSAAWGKSGRDIILLSKTPAGEAFITFMIMKWSQHKDFILDEIPKFGAMRPVH